MLNKNILFFRKSIYFFLGLSTIFIIWYIIALLLAKPFLPTPLETMLALLHLHEQYPIKQHLAISSARIFISLCLAIFIGAPLGYICGRYEKINQWIWPSISFLYPLPKIVFLPILIVLFGLGEISKVILITLIICFQIVVIVRDETIKLQQQWIYIMRTMTSSHWLWLRHLYIPYLLPSIITSLRISLGTAIAVLFFSETFVSIDGIGYMILDALEGRDYPNMYASILLLSLLGFICYGILSYLEEKTKYIV